mmetsp:Transcript_27308/g.74694  ORF Transcript_27308/g.74694 Transcript_27308/m.74694 type:complete len:833 (+) Transcript_27308:49-2547(+)
MDHHEPETIAFAISAIEKGVSRILKRHDHKTSEIARHRIQKLVEHARHILLELYNKRRSLKAFLRWFQKEWVRIEVYLDKYPVEILQHSMQHFLRCQDAFILLTSGECRHESDIESAKRTKFRSRLSSLPERGDGYTVLYKETGIYSGYGFDEFNNETVGIRALLVKELKRFHKSPWDYIERHGGTELLENLLDEHERETKELQHSLQSLKRVMIDNISKRLKPQNLKFATQDKMERLSLSIKAQTIALERRADSFQIEGPLLPNEKQRPEDWNYFALDLGNEGNQLSFSSRKRKRAPVIVDSESDDEIDDVRKKTSVEANDMSAKSSGLVVRVDSSSTNREKENSVSAIKSQVGVNTHDLEQAREILEEEGTKTKRVLEEEKVFRLEKILNRVLARDEIDENEVWDARECLRFACMEAGNKYLWDSQLGCVEKAIEYFEKAKKMVELQQNSQQLAGNESSLFVRLNLFYLHGQAAVNVGISLVDACHRKLSIPRVKMTRAIEELKRAKELMMNLRRLARNAYQSSSSTSANEATSYILKSKQLESLACRWMGRGLWLISEEKKAIASFEEAWLLLDDEVLRKMQQNAYSEDDILDLFAEAIYATCDLADRCFSKLKEVDHPTSSCQDKGYEILNVFTRALNRHVGIIKSIEQFSCPVWTKHFRVEYDIASAEDVTIYRNEIMNWWKGRCDNKIDDGDSRGNTQIRVQRQDPSLSTTNVTLSSNQPPTEYIFSSTCHKMKRREQRRERLRAGKNGRNHSQGAKMEALHALSNDALHYRPLPPLKFRKWGDELLIAEQQNTDKHNCSVSSGETGFVCLRYPSIAPPLPKEFQV